MGRLFPATTLDNAIPKPAEKDSDFIEIMGCANGGVRNSRRFMSIRRHQGTALRRIF
jgi:hypothetical protein